MFDHVKFGVSDYAASKAFFLQALAPLGVTLVGEGEPSYGACLLYTSGQRQRRKQRSIVNDAGQSLCMQHEGKLLDSDSILRRR